MFLKITSRNWFNPIVNSMLFICTCFFCSCYTTDIIKPVPREIANMPSDNIHAIDLKSGKKIWTENRKFEIDYDSLFRKSVINFHFVDTTKYGADKYKLVYKINSLSLDSINTMTFKKTNIPLTILAFTGALVVVLGALVAMWAASFHY